MAYIKIRIRGDTPENWSRVNPILEEREIAIEVAKQSASPWKLKIGDGQTPWNDLGYSFDYDAVNTLYINTHATYLEVQKLYDSFDSTWKSTSESFNASLESIKQSEIVILDAENNVSAMKEEIVELINSTLIQSTQEILNEVKAYLEEIQLAKDSFVLNVATGDASSYDVNSIDGGNAFTVDTYVYETGNANSILN